jgi:hypothetical protein
MNGDVLFQGIPHWARDMKSGDLGSSPGSVAGPQDSLGASVFSLCHGKVSNACSVPSSIYMRVKVTPLPHSLLPAKLCPSHSKSYAAP